VGAGRLREGVKLSLIDVGCAPAWGKLGWGRARARRKRRRKRRHLCLLLVEGG
jgi:hypothetical protein